MPPERNEHTDAIAHREPLARREREWQSDEHLDAERHCEWHGDGERDCEPDAERDAHGRCDAVTDELADAELDADANVVAVRDADKLRNTHTHAHELRDAEHCVVCDEHSLARRGAVA